MYLASSSMNQKMMHSDATARNSRARTRMRTYYTPHVSVLSNSLPAIVGYLVPEFSCATNMLIYFFRLAESF